MEIPLRAYLIIAGVSAGLMGLFVLAVVLLRKVRKDLEQDSGVQEKRPSFTLEELCRMRELHGTTDEEFSRIKQKALTEIEMTAPGVDAGEFLRELKVALEKRVIDQEEYRRLQRRILESVGR